MVGHDISCPYEEKSAQPRVAVLPKEKRTAPSWVRVNRSGCVTKTKNGGLPPSRA